MENHDIGWIAALLEGFDEQSDCSEIMADWIIELFSEAEKKLSPIIGVRGLAKLYHANLHQISLQHPWLSTAIENPEPSLEKFNLLKFALLKQHAEISKQGGLALLQGFYTKLVSLIGLTITEILLRSAWELLSAKHARRL